jgi:lysophospholipase L1-like esterase
MRDMTDTMYNPARWPFVSHIRGTELFIQHVERRICPTITSDQFIGGQPFAFSAATAGKKRLQIILLGDSTTEASIPKKLAPDEPQIEDMLRIKLVTEGDLPPCDVYNEGVSGEYIRRLLDTRYDKAVKTKPQADYIFIRYGINDRQASKTSRRQLPQGLSGVAHTPAPGPPEGHAHPDDAIPYCARQSARRHQRPHQADRRRGKAHALRHRPALPRRAEKEPRRLNYRRYSLAKIPENLRPFAMPYLARGAPIQKSSFSTTASTASLAISPAGQVIATRIWLATTSSPTRPRSGSHR